MKNIVLKHERLEAVLCGSSAITMYVGLYTWWRELEENMVNTKEERPPKARLGEVCRSRAPRVLCWRLQGPRFLLSVSPRSPSSSSRLRHLCRCSCENVAQSCEAEEQHALMMWNNKWETQVAPFIAQCEQVTRHQNRACYVHNKRLL